MIGIVFKMRSPLHVRVVERLFVRAAERGMGLALGPITVERPTDVVVSQLMEERVEGLVALNPDPQSRVLREASNLVPLVWLGEWAHTPEVDNVYLDEVEGLRLAVEHLVNLGHRDIVYVGGLGGPAGKSRADAFRNAMSMFGLAERTEVLASDFSEEDAANVARKIVLSSERPTAVICCADQCAVAVMEVFAQSGIRVPEEISVIGFDDSYLASLSYHSLTSVRQDVEAIVEATLEAVVGRIEGNEESHRVVSTPASLTVRNSTGPPRPPSTGSATAPTKERDVQKS
ncbi:LacI family DNA-binding transcriptional regulator [Pseudarthrobacter phenanthrenivorans]|uniref:LacI family DNA-binding transcriptional regulator n=1 Tax=Pseudarthrobacter phenanthrenivorans TaxID=361575 RepID=UPI001F0A8222|nr:substrate-binding domain-containing protein [Pseudarthrobacter phenanthrenivorans]